MSRTAISFVIAFVAVIAMVSAQVPGRTCYINSASVCGTVDSSEGWISICPPQPTAAPTAAPTPVPPTTLAPITPVPPITPIPPTTTAAPTPVPPTPAPTPVPPTTTAAPTPVPTTTTAAPPTPVPPTTTAAPPTPMPPTPVPTPAPERGPSDCMNVKVAKIAELDSTGREIAAHTITNFFGWGIQTAAGVPLPNCNTQPAGSTDSCITDQQVVTADVVITATNLGFGQLTIYVASPTRDVTLKYGNDTTAIRARDVKFSLSLSGYTFCTALTCGAGNVGVAVVIDFIVEGVNNRLLAQSGNTLSVANGGSIYNFPVYSAGTAFSQTWRSISPSTSNIFGNSVTRYRFDGPFDTVEYDPVIRRPDSTTDSSASTMATMVAVILGLLLLVL